jgi:hypothetical protein
VVDQLGQRLAPQHRGGRASWRPGGRLHPITGGGIAEGDQHAEAVAIRHAEQLPRGPLLIRRRETGVAGADVLGVRRQQQVLGDPPGVEREARLLAVHHHRDADRCIGDELGVGAQARQLRARRGVAHDHELPGLAIGRAAAPAPRLQDGA